MTPASVGFHCPECTRSGSQRVYTSRTLPGSRPIVTLVIIGINVAVFVVGLAQGGSFGTGRGTLFANGALFGPLVDEGEWWRLFTSGFLHLGLAHIALNMLVLYLLGPQLEMALGRVAFSVLYLMSLLAGSLGVLVADPLAPTVGASGAVFGLMGAFLVAHRAQGVSPWQSGIGGLLLINLVLTFLLPGISIGGHVGGLVGGLIGGALLFELPRHMPVPRWLPTAMCALFAVGFFVASLWAASQWMTRV